MVEEEDMMVVDMMVIYDVEEDMMEDIVVEDMIVDMVRRMLCLALNFLLNS